jgi:hypothetical protein
MEAEKGILYWCPKIKKVCGDLVNGKCTWDSTKKQCDEVKNS